MRILKQVLVLLTLTAILILGGCGGSGGGSGTGTLSVRLADASDPTITSVNVTIDRVEAHVDGQWVPITTTPQTFNLYDLIENDTLLGSANLPAGSYTQIRLFPSAAEITDADGTHEVNIPSGDQTGVKVLVNYNISSNDITTVLLDFNVDKSFNKTGAGQYQMQPVIKGVVKVLSGTITGVVSIGDTPVQGATVEAWLPGGTEAVNSGVTQEDGTFKIWALLPETYELRVSYTDPDTSDAYEGTAADIAVDANANSDAGDIELTLIP
jgi:hypothetical protein